MARGFCPQNRAAAVVPSGRVRRQLCTAVRHARFLGWSSPRRGGFLNERSPLRPSTLALERWNTSARVAACALSAFCSIALKPPNALSGSNSGLRRRAASARSGAPLVTVRGAATRSS